MPLHVWTALFLLWRCFLLVQTADVIRIVKIARPDFTMYHEEGVLMDKIKKLVASSGNNMSIETLSGKNGKYSAQMEVVSVDLGGLTTTTADGPVKEKLRILLDFGEHGRELISTEVGMRLLEILADETRLRSELAASMPADKAALTMSLLKCCVQFKVIPMENHGGRRLVEKGDICERKNGNKVDPNRNWGVDWGVREKDYNSYEEYGGTGPFSEPEAAMVRDTAIAFKPHMWINVHSGMEGIFMPYDHVEKVANGPHDRYTREMLDELNVASCNSLCTVGSGGASVGYLAHGTATDYMFVTLKVPVAMTWEIYGDPKANQNDCFRIFNPLDKATFDDILHRWSMAIFNAALLMVKHPSVKGLDLEARLAEHMPVHVQSDLDTSADLVKPVRDMSPLVGGWMGVDARIASRHRDEESARQLTTDRLIFQGKVAACVVVMLLLWQGARHCMGAAKRRKRKVTAGHE